MNAIEAAGRAYVDANAGSYAWAISNDMCRGMGIVCYLAGVKASPPTSGVLSAIDIDVMLAELNTIIVDQVSKLPR